MSSTIFSFITIKSSKASSKYCTFYKIPFGWIIFYKPSKYHTCCDVILSCKRFTYQRKLIVCSSLKLQIQKEYPATFMLKSIHDKASKAQIQTPKPLPIINNNQTRKRNRKPDKSSICHVVPEVSEVICHDDIQHNDVDDQEEEEEEEESIPSPLKQILDGVGKSKPEVTITPALKTTTIMSPEDYKQVLIRDIYTAMLKIVTTFYVSLDFDPLFQCWVDFYLIN